MTTESGIDTRIREIPIESTPEIEAWREELEALTQSKLNEARKVAAARLYEAIKAQTEPILTQRTIMGPRDVRRLPAPTTGGEVFRELILEARNVTHSSGGSFRDHEFTIGFIDSAEGNEDKLTPVYEIDSKVNLLSDCSVQVMQDFISEILLLRELERLLIADDSDREVPEVDL